MTTQSKVFETLLRKRFVRERWVEPVGTMDEPCDADDEGAEAVLANPDGPAAVEAMKAVVEAGNKLLEWWPEGSENGTAAERYGEGFAADLTAFRTALGALNNG